MTRYEDHGNATVVVMLSASRSGIRGDVTCRGSPHPGTVSPATADVRPSSAHRLASGSEIRPAAVGRHHQCHWPGWRVDAQRMAVRRSLWPHDRARSVGTDHRDGLAHPV
jgi:hypothetical protein